MSLKSRWMLWTMVLTLSAAAANITITIDPNTRYQTIIGFGGSAGEANGQQASELVNDVGYSVMRFDWCGGLGPKAFWDAGCHTFVASCWSPPANMKDNNSTVNGGHLKPTSYEAFGDHAVQHLKAFKNMYGSELYALSPQNEPAFAEFYNSCVYEGADLIEVTKVIGRKIQEAGLTTKLFIPEDVYDNWAHYNRYIVPEAANIKKYVAAFAFHSYTESGVMWAKTTPSVLSRINQFATSYGWEVWQTENAGIGSVYYADELINCLRYGKLTMHLKFDLVGSSGGLMGTVDQYLIYQGKKTLTYYVGKTFAKFIRPGSVQLKSTSSDSATFDKFVAFYDKKASALVVTLATGSSGQTVTLAGPGLPSSYEKWVTNANTMCVNQGSVGPTGIEIPANSAITLYGTGYTPPAVGLAAPAARAHLPGKPSAHLASYTLTGARLSATHALSRGCVITRAAACGVRLRSGL